MSDGVGGRGEHRLGLGHQAGAGEHAALDVTSRAAHGRLLVAGVAGGTIGSRRRVGLSSVRAGGVIGGRNRLRSVRDGGGRPCGVGDDAGAPVFVKGAHRDAELPSAGAAADPGSEQFGGFVGHPGVDDGTPAPPARLEKGVFAALSIAFDGACHGRAGEVEGGHDVGLRDAGNDVQLGGAQQHGAAVVGGVAIEGFEVEEVVGEAVAGLHGVAVADGSGVRKGEGQGEDHGQAPVMYHSILAYPTIRCQAEIARESKRGQKNRFIGAFGSYRGSRSAHHVRKSEFTSSLLCPSQLAPRQRVGCAAGAPDVAPPRSCWRAARLRLPTPCRWPWPGGTHFASPRAERASSLRTIRP